MNSRSGEEQKVMPFGTETNAMAINWPAYRESVLACFPKMCPNHIELKAPEHQWNPESFIGFTLDELENGRSYPRRARPRKRKREEEEQPDKQETPAKPAEVAASHVNKDSDYIKTYVKTSKYLLMLAFPLVYATDVDHLLSENKLMVYPSYLALDKEFASGNPNPRFKTKQVPTKFSDADSIEPGSSSFFGQRDAWRDFQAALDLCKADAAQRSESKLREEEEARNLQEAKLEGNVAECQCCCDEFILNKMVHCNADVIHWFCVDCAKRMAENEIGLSKYKLTCMSMDGCSAGFSLGQRALFLDDKLAVALGRIEQEAVLRMAGIENLETCPFCPYAAEYPPVEVNKEFRCDNPECELVSCRLCREETHIPKTCDEAAREKGISARRRIEEAMSAAMIRTCNKCGTPFIKETGCNKMMCTRNGCRNIQCYVCSKSCDYSHFDDSLRGGKKGNCPLFESVDKRHEEDVRAAEEKARKEVVEENPNVDVSMLDINFSERVREDGRRRVVSTPAHMQHVHGI
ncbi:hypothetical protein B0T17DRAFT_86791 [Bombardia bombarda]|uniref:RING-type domain-containing protein n=1 Tax=Bombardia bombarda TaxID=252184 RepID=A0AA40CFA2_9PEZI|nr:hypothetical protein B0T17DRAFT_86791 [Bombardia bombarda]